MQVVDEKRRDKYIELFPYIRYDKSKDIMKTRAPW